MVSSASHTEIQQPNNSAFPSLLKSSLQINRSCEVVIAYLIKLRGWSLSESYQWVKDRHKSCVLKEGVLAKDDLV